ncbi:EscU/YscU/HrcU family type III secretion system export apparatus switch protein, partial [bacterium]|nr:EscU/YscU/HrcU family type III secretion system export apparatus switch protein [bacterium]
LGVAWFFLKARAFEAGHYFNRSVPEVTTLILNDTLRLFFMLAGVLGVLAAGDFFYQRYRVEKQMRMTKREVREEYKLREGDPLMKSRIRNVQRRMARRRMLEAVPKADVIITNPTHYSVALQYDPDKMNAPRVVAKGVDFLAMKIREIAKGAGVPLVENRQLARALYAQIPVGKSITKDLYSAVAQVLSYVYRLKGRSAQAVA